VLTGLVVAVSTTALLLVLICRFFETGGGLPDGETPPDGPKDQPADEAPENAPKSAAQEEADK
jgi:hypothetical protein